METILTPSQTAGPFFHLGLFGASSLGTIANAGAKGDRIHIGCRVLDGDAVPLPDAMIEVWQANAAGRYRHPDDTQDKPLDPAFNGFGRFATTADGSCMFETVQPGRVPDPNNSLQAPHLNISVFARGLLKRAATRLYFAGDPANGEDSVLALVPESRRHTLLAQPAPGQPGFWRYDIYLSGEHETVFFEI
jgi:protocatechuate 3,4-dioxygenase, alpha subunit